MAKKIQQNKCRPLAILKAYDDGKDGFYQNSIDHGMFTDKISRKEFVDYVLSMPGALPSNPAIDRALIFAYESMMEYYNSEEVMSQDASKFDPITEVKDLTTMSEIMRLWGKHKQIYKINKEFMSELTKTTNMKVPVSSLEHLPVDLMYIDFEDSDELYPIVGAFVYVIPNNGEPQLAIIMVTFEDTFFSYYTTFHYEDGIADVPKTLIANMTPFSILAASTEEGLRGKKYQNDRRETIVKAIIQVLLFLSADNTDISENPVTKKTYRKPTTEPKHKFSEVQMWDVGVRYGKAIELSKRNASKGVYDESDTSDSGDHVKRSVRPHIRSAHWQRYRVGKGRKEIRVHWIAPIMVNSDSEDGEDITAVIREVKQ